MTSEEAVAFKLFLKLGEGHGIFLTPLIRDYIGKVPIDLGIKYGLAIYYLGLGAAAKLQHKGAAAFQLIYDLAEVHLERCILKRLLEEGIGMDLIALKGILDIAGDKKEIKIKNQPMKI